MTESLQPFPIHVCHFGTALSYQTNSMVYAVLVAALAHIPTSEESRTTGLRLLQNGYLPCSGFDNPSSVLDPSCECPPNPSKRVLQ